MQHCSNKQHRSESNKKQGCQLVISSDSRIKKWEGHCGAKEKVESNTNVYPVWWFSVVFKINLLWSTSSNPTQARGCRYIWRNVHSL